MRKLRHILSTGAFACVVILSTTLAVDGADRIEASEVEIGQDVTAVENPWYSYSGYTGYNHDGEFILDPYFVNAVAYQNFTVNGYEIDGSKEAMDEYGENHTVVETYDHQILKYADGKAIGVSFPVNSGVVSKEALFDVYGETENAAPSDPDEVAYYNYQIEDQRIQFIVRDGWVTEVRYGGDLMNHS